MNSSISTMPGKMPAANKRAIETSADTPSTMKVMDGGIMMPSVPALVSAPMLNVGS